MRLGLLMSFYDGAVNLIDFSRNLYVALFFACNGKMKENGELIMLNTNKIGKTDDIDYKETVPLITIIEPAHSDTSRHSISTNKKEETLNKLEKENAQNDA